MSLQINLGGQKDWREWTWGAGGTLFLCQTAAKRAKIIYFSKLQPRLILGTGLVGPQLLNILRFRSTIVITSLPYSAKDVLLICILCIFYTSYFIRSQHHKMLIKFNSLSIQFKCCESILQWSMLAFLDSKAIFFKPNNFFLFASGAGIFKPLLTHLNKAMIVACQHI